MTVRSGDTAGKFTTGPPQRQQGGFQRGRILILDDGFDAGDGIDRGDGGQSAHAEVVGGLRQWRPDIPSVVRFFWCGARGVRVGINLQRKEFLIHIQMW